MRGSSVSILVASLLCICNVALQVRATPVELRWPPDKFPENRDLANESLMGPTIEDVKPLGRIVRLDTFFDPTDVQTLSTKFTIHTRSGASKMMAFVANGFVYSSFSPERYHYNLTEMAASKFDSRKRTVILISGFLTGDKIDWLDRVKDLWLKLEDCNVIIVTWKEGNRFVYSRAAATTPRVARQISIFLHYLASMQQDSIENEQFAARVHFIGHSLGSHIAGFVGQDLAGRMGRIVALDPAGPSFDQFQSEHRLDKSDARLVEAIHTNSGKMKYTSVLTTSAKVTLNKVLNLIRGKNEMARSIAETFSGEGDPIWFGIDMQVGHIDYYANNGRTQPGCTDIVHTCDHGRVHHVYEGMLNHELALKEASASSSSWPNQLNGLTYEQWRRDKRLLAINAADYAGFSSGEAINQRCPSVLHDRERLQGIAEQHMPLCTIPFDQLTPVDELIKELELVHGLALHGDSPTSGQRFYFKTLAAKPFAGDHYMLRVKLERSSNWDKSCALQADISFANDQSTTIELDKELRAFSNGKFFGLSLPFVNPNNASARLALDRMLRDYTIENKNQNKHEIDSDTRPLIELILPSSVSLKIIQSKGASTFSSWTKYNQAGPKCLLAVNSIQVHPLIGNRRSLFGRYSSQRLSGNSIKMMSHLEYKTRKHSEKVWPDTLLPDNQTRERPLQLVVIG